MRIMILREIELTPQRGVWFGYDSNPGGERKNLTHVSHDCDRIHTWSKSTGPSKWEAGVSSSMYMMHLGNDKSLLYRCSFLFLSLGIHTHTAWPSSACRCTKISGKESPRPIRRHVEQKTAHSLAQIVHEQRSPIFISQHISAT